MKDLKLRLFKDLTLLNLPVDFDLDIRGYSKQNYGLYDPNAMKVILYVYQDPECTKLFDYGCILEQTVHEVCHHIQWQNPFHIRYKGVMHDTEFYSLFNEYKKRVRALMLCREVEYVCPSIVGEMCSFFHGNDSADFAFI